MFQQREVQLRCGPRVEGRQPESDGKLVTCDLSEEWPAMARRARQQAGLLDRIELRLGDALETLVTLLLERGPDCFDLVFVDADKAHYPQYYEQSVALTRPGGLIVLDNTLWSGRIIDQTQQDADGMTLARKR